MMMINDDLLNTFIKEKRQREQSLESTLEDGGHLKKPQSLSKKGESTMRLLNQPRASLDDDL
jgi:hypothetical protein